MLLKLIDMPGRRNAIVCLSRVEYDVLHADALAGRFDLVVARHASFAARKAPGVRKRAARDIERAVRFAVQLFGELEEAE